MKPENLNIEETREVDVVETGSVLNKVTSLSKYLAMVLFIIMPFIGGWIGYQYAPEKVVEVERVVVKEVDKIIIQDSDTQGKPIHMSPVFFDDFFTEDDDEYFYGVGGEKYFWSWKNEDEDSDEKMLHVFNPIPFDEGVSINTYSGVDIDTFKELDGAFARDKEHVYYFGVHSSSGLLGEVVGADPETFEVKDLFGRSNQFGTDKASIYFLSKKLEGINPKTATMTDKGVIRDEDTFWIPSGNCHFGNYRLGSLDEIDIFEPPC